MAAASIRSGSFSRLASHFWTVYCLASSRPPSTARWSHFTSPLIFPSFHVAGWSNRGKGTRECLRLKCMHPRSRDPFLSHPESAPPGITKNASAFGSTGRSIKRNWAAYYAAATVRVYLQYTRNLPLRVVIIDANIMKNAVGLPARSVSCIVPLFFLSIH